MRVPKIWQLFTEFLRLPAPLARQLWRVLYRSNYSAPASLRQALLLYDAAPMWDAKALVHEALSPQRIVAVLEALVHEGLLSRQEANQYEEYILKCTRQGQWY